MRTIKNILFISIILLAFTKCSNNNTAASSADWKLGVQLWTFRLFSFTDAVNKADSAGIRYIEAFPGQPLGGNMRDSFGVAMSPASRAQIKELLKGKNIQMVAIGVIVPKNIAEWQQYFELAKEFNLSYISTEPLKDQWDAVDSLAGVYNIKIAIHDHPNPTAYWSPDSVLAAIKGHPNIGACADVGHWARSGFDPVECLKKLEGHVYGAHLKDIKVFNDTHAADTIVGKGVINFDAIFTELKRQKFSGMMSIEQESNWEHNMQDVAATAKYVDEKIKAVKP